MAVIVVGDIVIVECCINRICSCKSRRTCYNNHMCCCSSSMCGGRVDFLIVRGVGVVIVAVVVVIDVHVVIIVLYVYGNSYVFM